MGDRGSEALRGVDLEIHAGEIVGLAGVSATGSASWPSAWPAIRKVNSRESDLGNKDITPPRSINGWKPGGFHPRGAYAGRRDPRVLGGGEHLPARPCFFRLTRNGIFLDFKAMATHASDLVREFTVKTPGLDTPLKNLSGGNIRS